ncbi:MAG: right-handed parallel beta-helix repeat-containing protein [Bacteroidales bacterium]|nr:right-handed parallel beta-helix repeat-containing protein [Candidatus Physcousia equi]
MKQKLFYILFSMLIFVAMSCDDYDKWTTSPLATLRLSCDTVNFGTVITEQSSPTQTMWLWNDHKEGIRISDIRLAEGSSSLFRVNVDGRYLSNGQGADFEVRGADSLCVRLEVKAPDIDSDEPHKHSDKLLFTLESGRQQELVLEAEGQDVRILKAQQFDRDATLKAGRPYLVYDSLVVLSDATLSIEPGAILLFHDGVSLVVRGSLQAVGEVEKPIIFRGDRMDNLLDYLPYDNTTNRWGGIHFMPNCKPSRLAHCDIHSGDYGIQLDESEKIDSDVPSLHLSNSIIHNVAGAALSVRDNSAIVEGTQFSNALGNVVDLLGGHTSFTHCTMAQFYPWLAERGAALCLADHVGDGPHRVDHPLLSASFVNCIVTGYADDVVEFSLTDTQDARSPWLISHCLLRTPHTSDDRLVEVIFDEEDLSPNGKDHFSLFDTENFLYDFTPKPESIVRGKADPSVTQMISPNDRRGRKRIHDDGTSDLGSEAYYEN